MRPESYKNSIHDVKKKKKKKEERGKGVIRKKKDPELLHVVHLNRLNETP